MDIGTPERYLQASWDILEGASRPSVGATRRRGLFVDGGVGGRPASAAIGAAGGGRGGGCSVGDGRAGRADSVLLESCDGRRRGARSTARSSLRASSVGEGATDRRRERRSAKAP